MKIQPSSQAKRTAAFGAVATAVYLAMVLGSLPRLEALSGHTPFDMRPLGYSPDEARALLAALGEEGRAFSLRCQLALDTIYPALMALTLAGLFRLAGRGLALERAAAAGLAASWLAAGFDYAENAGIALMLRHVNPPEALMIAASHATVAKSLTTSAAVFGLLALFLWRIWSVKAAGRPGGVERTVS